jgi:hypothetical protein
LTCGWRHPKNPCSPEAICRHRRGCSGPIRSDWRKKTTGKAPDPPPVANWVCSGSDIGDSAGSAGSGAAGAAGPATAGAGPLRAGTAPAPALAAVAAVVAAGSAPLLPIAVVPEVIPGDASDAPGVEAVTPPTTAAAGAVSSALARALLPATAAGSAADRPGIGAVAFAAAEPPGAGRPRECMPEPCEPPRASALAAKQTSTRATAGTRYR